jgi:2-dehydro-3-deoxyphosphogalactonate aldolase
LPAYWHAGADGFGIGSALYTPGRSPEDVAQAAVEFIAAWRKLL